MLNGLKLPLFITFEGGEGAGKTTLIQGLKNKFQEAGYFVIETREPGGTKLSDAIRDVLLHRENHIGAKAELLLFLAARAQAIDEIIAPSLKEDKVVLCDRFKDSTVAYQGYARGLGMENVSELCQYVTDPIRPNITFYLDIPPDKGLERRKSNGLSFDRIEEEKIHFHQLVREAFLKIAKHDANRVKIIDATQTADLVLNQAWNHILANT